MLIVVHLKEKINVAMYCFGGLRLPCQQDAVTDFVRLAHEATPLEGAVFNIGVNVKFPPVKTTDWAFRKVWKSVRYAGFLIGRHPPRRMLPHGRGLILLLRRQARAAAMLLRFSLAPISDLEQLLKASHWSSTRETSARYVDP
jgi:hypothetical protein